MADKLTASQLVDYGARVMRRKVARYASVDNSAISQTEITSRVKSWGKIKFEVYNRHPGDRGNLVFPVLSMLVDNHDGYFDRGGVLFPNGSPDFASTEVRVTCGIAEGAGVHMVLDFTGRLREPEYTGEGDLELVVEHALTELTTRKWVRADRSGGDTGQDYTV